jgi:hypothetical protein
LYYILETYLFSYVNAGSAAGGKKKGPNAQNVSNVAAPPEKKE